MHQVEFKVRDYECDIQGIVNNSVYTNYLEHARHEFLLANGINFIALAQDRINLVVTRAELDYKQSLKPGDGFYVCTRIEKISMLKFAFLQDIYHQNNKLILTAKIIGVALNERNRPIKLKTITKLQFNF